MSEGITAELGGTNYRIVPQGIGRIKRKLGSLLGLQDGSTALTGEVDAELYSFLKTFIPDVAPLHTLLGYSSEDAYKADGEPEGGIEEVTLPQLLDAIQAIYTVNGADRLVRLGKALGLDAVLLRDLFKREVAGWALERSASLPAPSGESPSESSTETPPTLTVPSEAPSPSRDSSISSTPESPAAIAT